LMPLLPAVLLLAPPLWSLLLLLSLSLTARNPTPF
jgi:hypothetical protein